MILDGHFREEYCKNAYHWTWKVPTSELDIPLDKNFKPKTCNYIYYYLIECYKNTASTRNVKLQASTNFIQSCEKEIASLTIKLREAKRERDRLQESKDQNDIFNGYAINSYKTPTGKTTVRAKPTKRAKVAPITVPPKKT